MTERRSAVLCCVLLLLMASVGAVQSAWSQEVSAAIVGTVVDASGAPIKGATVTATSIRITAQSAWRRPMIQVHTTSLA